MNVCRDQFRPICGDQTRHVVSTGAIPVSLAQNPRAPPSALITFSWADVPIWVLLSDRITTYHKTVDRREATRDSRT